jgi:hypothetical protein
MLVSLVVMSALPILLPSPLNTHTHTIKLTAVLYCMSASKHVKYKTKHYSISIAPYPPSSRYCCHREVVSFKTKILFHTITTTTKTKCVTILQQQSQNTGVCFCCSFQLNKQSINLITSLCWSYFSKTKLPTYYTPFSKISKLFLAALQVTEITASLTACR